MPPYGIYDLAWQQTNGSLPPCNVPECNNTTHNNEAHWGCYNLLCQVQNRVKPFIHLYGHIHDTVGCRYDKQWNILWINSAMDIRNKCHRTKIIFDLDANGKALSTTAHKKQKKNKKRKFKSVAT